MTENINHMNAQPNPAESGNEATSGEAPPATLPGCEVVELDQDTGWDMWEDSKFVQDFEDSILG